MLSTLFSSTTTTTNNIYLDNYSFYSCLLWFCLALSISKTPFPLGGERTLRVRATGTRERVALSARWPWRRDSERKRFFGELSFTEPRNPRGWFFPPSTSPANIVPHIQLNCSDDLLRFFGDFLPRFLAISGPNKIIIISLGWGEGEGASSGGQWEMPSAAPSARWP